LSPEESRAIQQGLADARAGQFAHDEDIEAIFRKARASRK
jgi:predicted transcriptional regulator